MSSTKKKEEEKEREKHFNNEAVKVESNALK